MNTTNLAPIARYRRVKAFFSLFLTFVAAGSLGGLLNIATPLWSLVNMSLVLSMPATAGIYASMNIFIVVVGLIVLTAGYASFSALEGSPVVIVAGAVSLCGYMIFAVGWGTALVTMAVILPPVLFVRFTLHKLSYKQALTMNTLYYLLLIVASVGFYLYENRLEGATFAELLHSNVPIFVENYGALALQQPISNFSVPLTAILSTRAAVNMLINYCPALFVSFSMLLSFFVTTYFVKNSGFVPIRVGVVSKSFTMSKAGALAFVLAALGMLLGSGLSAGLYHTVLNNFMTILTLPLSLVGLNSVRKGLMRRGGMITWLLLFVLLITMPLASMFLFFAMFGAVDTLMSKVVQ